MPSFKTTERRACLGHWPQSMILSPSHNSVVGSVHPESYAASSADLQSGPCHPDAYADAIRVRRDAVVTNDRVGAP